MKSTANYSFTRNAGQVEQGVDVATYSFCNPIFILGFARYSHCLSKGSGALVSARRSRQPMSVASCSRRNLLATGQHHFNVGYRRQMLVAFGTSREVGHHFLKGYFLASGGDDARADLGSGQSSVRRHAFVLPEMSM
jgi:hypothetical protein